MKNIICILASVAVSATLMIGCGSKTASTTSAESNQTTESAPNDNGSNKQGNFQKADLEGEVTSVSGNKVTLKVIKSPEKPADGGKNTTTSNGEKPADSNGQSTNSDSNKPANPDGNGKDKQGSAPQKRQVEYTGETKEITISDGVQIKTMARGQQNSESKTLSASDIKVGNVLRITYSDESKETISTIDVMGSDNQKETAK